MDPSLQLSKVQQDVVTVGWLGARSEFFIDLELWLLDSKNPMSDPVSLTAYPFRQY